MQVNFCICKKLFFITAIFLVALLSCNKVIRQSTAKSPAQRPNIIFVFIDDMGYRDLSSYGNLEMKTPNIDRIATEGIRFTNFYVSSPICSPSRVAIFTGQYPGRQKIYSYLATREQNRNRGMADYLNSSVPNMARSFKNAGYMTAHFGKWHMGGGRDVDDAPLPTEFGFDQSLVSFEGLGDRLLEKNQGLSTASAKLGKGNITWVEKWEKTGIYVDRTLDFISKNKNTPFFIQLWPGDVHDPHIPNPEWREKFKQFSNDHYKQDFFAVLYNLDLQIGRLLNKLDELKLSKNTLIVLTSDNGPTDWSYYYKEGFWPPGSADPFRGRKWSLYEGGTRMPFIARWPGHIPAGVVNQSTIMNAVDLFPTLANIANIPSSSGNLDGENMTKALLGGKQERTKPIFWEYGRNEFDIKPGNIRFVSPNTAIREGDWKLLMNSDGSSKELYNLNDDPAEQKNLAKDRPDIASRLTQSLLDWYKSLP